MKNKYEFTIEELNCYTITIEEENEDMAWEVFNTMKDWFSHPTCVEHDTNVDIQVTEVVHCQNCKDYGCHDCEAKQ